MTWRKGQPWRRVHSLDRLNEQIRAAYPRAVPPATPATAWGSLADDAHSSDSDHFPHYYAALGKVAVVCAGDFPHAPELGLDFGEAAEALRLSKDPRIKYVIFDGRMFSSYAAHGYAPYTWRPYSGKDMHRTHGHISTVATAAADDPRDWQIGEDDMPITDADAVKIARAMVNQKVGGSSSPTVGELLQALEPAIAREGTNPTELAAALAGLPQVDPAKLAAQIASLLPATQVKQLADELARRLAS
ncbi:hypothetical protein [Micromonospora sp. CB01531]|uniref:hypothetical protein n=1 Tax=Micromonospora sp. CB01531 TaxID=1718947 RepID=UPI00093A7F02|nr:hypothetical protein [Micromonospora sp. CB01531]OKI47313.1 hypothetical protein A6A27_10725 [Micromonospora sp. CB01531]